LIHDKSERTGSEFSLFPIFKTISPDVTKEILAGFKASWAGFDPNFEV
jgi:hypothetical protein